MEGGEEGDIEGGWRDLCRENGWRHRRRYGGWVDREVKEGVG